MVLWSISLLSFVLLALQIVLIQTISAAQGHHLAYIVLSVALLGFGAGGSVLTLRNLRGRPSLDSLYVPTLLLCAWSTAWLAFPARVLLDGFELELLFTRPGPALRVIALGLFLFIPFFSGAIALSAAFAEHPRQIGARYAANLAGSAAGAAAILPALHRWLPEQLLPALATLVLLAAIGSKPRRIWVGLTAAGIATAALLSSPLPPSPYKPLSYALQLPDAIHEGPLPHPLGRIDRVEAPALRYAPDLSLRYTGPVPSPPHLYRDGSTSAILLGPEHPEAVILDQTPQALPFHAGLGGKTLVLLPDGSPLLNLVAHYGADATWVEPHPLIIRHIKPLFPCNPPRIEQDQPRRILSRLDSDSVDLILFPFRGTFGGATGLQALNEDPLMTVEAVRKALRGLRSDGALGFNVWLDDPLRHTPRVVDLAAEALRAEGIESPGDHLILIRGWGSASLLVHKQPITPCLLESIYTFTQARGFDRIWPPSDAPRRHGKTDDPLDQTIAGLLGSNPELFRTSYPFDIRAPTDDRPFFNQFLHPGTNRSATRQLSVSERGLHLLQWTLPLLLAAVLLLLLGPLLPLRIPPLRSPFTPLCFTGLGAGFMLFEVALIQRLMPLWGHAATSTALVITSLLAGMGAGSLLSRYLPARPAVLCSVCLFNALLLGAVLQGIPFLYEPLFLMSPLQQNSTVLLLLSLAAIPLGIPFALGVRILAKTDSRQIPWACGIDGATAVLVAPSAALLALSFGYSSLTYAAVAAYLLSAIGSLCPTCRAAGKAHGEPRL